MEFETAVVEFLEAATDGRSDRARRLLALYPSIASASLYTALVLGDDTAVDEHLAREPALARRSGGPRDWDPLHYLCHSSLAESVGANGYAACARRLLALGADPRARFPWLHHGVRRPVLWGATTKTRSLPLAEVLLEAGADPNDGVTLPLAAARGDLPVLDLLLANGADVNQPWATDGSATLYAILHWADTPVGAQWLLEHGADPDPVFAENGETPLHVVARRWNADLGEALVSRGANLARPRADGRTAFAVAELSGNRNVADWLLARGAPDELSEVDRFVAALGRGDRAEAEAMLSERPGLSGQIDGGHYGALYEAAERGDAEALETMLTGGFDPNHTDDEMGKTPLHSAAMAGRPEAVRVLLAHGASVTVRDREFDAQPLVWAAEGSRSTRGDDRNHAEVAQLLIDAGSPLEWESGNGPPEGIIEVLDEWRRVMASADRR
jgi:ankyrin repeat protein